MIVYYWMDESFIGVWEYLRTIEFDTASEQEVFNKDVVCQKHGAANALVKSQICTPLAELYVTRLLEAIQKESSMSFLGLGCMRQREHYVWNWSRCS